MVAAEFIEKVVEQTAVAGEKAKELAGQAADAAKKTADVLGKVKDPPGMVPTVATVTDALPDGLASPAAAAPAAVRDVPSHEPLDTSAMPEVNGDPQNHVTQGDVAVAQGAGQDDEASRAAQWVQEAGTDRANGARGSVNGSSEHGSSQDAAGGQGGASQENGARSSQDAGASASATETVFQTSSGNGSRTGSGRSESGGSQAVPLTEPSADTVNSNGQGTNASTGTVNMADSGASAEAAAKNDGSSPRGDGPTGSADDGGDQVHGDRQVQPEEQAGANTASDRSSAGVPVFATKAEMNAWQRDLTPGYYEYVDPDGNRGSVIVDGVVEDGPPKSGRDTKDKTSYTEEFNGKRYEVTANKDGTLDYTEIADQNHPVDAPADGAAPEQGSRSRADVEAELEHAKARELTYSYYRYSPAHTEAMNDVARLQAELDALGPAEDTTEAPSTRDTADQGHPAPSGQGDLPEKPGRAFYQDVTGRPEHQGQAEPVYANVTDAQSSRKAEPATDTADTDASASGSATPAAGTGRPAEGQGQAQYKVKPPPAAAQAQAAERPHPAEVQQQEHTTAGWSPSRVSDGLRGPTGEKIAIQGDGTQPVVLGNRGYYDNGDPLPANVLEGHREAANATVNAVNQTAEGAQGKFTTGNTAVHGEVRVLQDPAGQAPSADIPAYRGALENIHGGQVGPTVLSNVVLNPDGSINSATMTTMHRVHGGQVRTVTSEITNGTIATPSTEGGNVNGTNPSALQYLTNDQVHSVPAGPGGPDGGSGGGPNGGGSSGSGGSGSPDGGQRYLVLAPPGAAYVAEPEQRPQFSGEIHPAAARVLRRYQEAEQRSQARAAARPDEGTDGGTGGQARTRTRTQPGEPAGQPTGGETQGQTRASGQGGERILIQRPRIAEPEPTPTTRQREQANGQASGGRGQERQADGQPRTDGQPEARTDGRARPDQQARPRGQGQPDQQGQPDGQGGSGGQGREQGRPEADGQGRPKADGKPDGRPRTEEKADGEAKTEEKAKGRGRRRKASARQRQAEARAKQQAEEQEARANAKTQAGARAEEDTRTLYEILGIKDHKKATKADIRKAYIAKTKELRPDGTSATEDSIDRDEYTKVTAAYRILNNEKAKRNYDVQQAIKHIFDALRLGRKAAGATMEPGTAYDVGKAIGELPGLPQEVQAAWALANILDVIRLLNGYKQMPVDGGLFGMNEETQKRYQILLIPTGAAGDNGIVLRVNHLDPETGARTDKIDYLRITQGAGNQVRVQGSEGVADILDDPKLQDVGKDGGPATDQERVDAALKALSDALVLDYEQVKTANPVDVYEQAKETAQANGGGDDPDNKDDDGNKDDDKKDKDEEEKKEPWKVWDEKDKVPQKPLWQMTDAERKAFFDQVVGDRMEALKREYAAKRRESGEKLRVRSNETVKEAEARRRREDEKKMEQERLKVELGVMNEIIRDLEAERFLRLQSPATSPKEMRQISKTISKMEREAIRHQDEVIQDWRKEKKMEPSTAQSYKEFRWGAKAKGKKGNTHKRGYTEEQLANMKGLRHPNRPENRHDGRGPERKPNGKRKLVSREEFKQRRREYRQTRREHDNYKSEYLNLLAKQKALKAQLSKAKGKDRGILKAELRAVRHNISASRRGMHDSWRRMEANSYHGMVARAAGRAVLNQVNK